MSFDDIVVAWGDVSVNQNPLAHAAFDVALPGCPRLTTAPIVRVDPRCNGAQRLVAGASDAAVLEEQGERVAYEVGELVELVAQPRLTRRQIGGALAALEKI